MVEDVEKQGGIHAAVVKAAPLADKISDCGLYIGNLCLPAFVLHQDDEVRLDVEGVDCSRNHAGCRQGECSVATAEFDQVAYPAIDAERAQDRFRLEKSGPHRFIGHAAVTYLQDDPQMEYSTPSAARW